MTRQAKISTGIIISFDVIGFTLMIIGGGLIRYAKSEPIAIVGGVVIAAGVAILGLTRCVK